MKFLRMVKKVFLTILAVIFFTFAILMTMIILNRNKRGITEIDKYSLIFVTEKISSEKYHKGDAVIVESKKIANIKIGDDAFTYKVDKSGTVSIDVGEVGETNAEAENISFKNGSVYSEDLIIGVPYKIYANLGTFLTIILSQWGFFFAILIPSFLIFVHQIYLLIIEIKYGSEENN